MKITPVICGSAFKNKGVQNLLDAICLYLPNPYDVPAITGINPDTDEEEIVILIQKNHLQLLLSKLQPILLLVVLHSSGFIQEHFSQEVMC